ncbi:MAG: amidohydrolase family protein [Novosphingobium sp.]|nr:amidohydrolase family protein [Novosphingobium sp.]
MKRIRETRDLGYPVYDADGHYYETADAFRRHLPKKFHKDFLYVQVDGRTKLAVNGHLSDYIPNPTFDVVAAPGAHELWYRAENWDGKSLRELTGDVLAYQSEFSNPETRLKLLDEQGVHAQLIFPTLASVIEGHMGNNIELMAACVHSLNAWVVDEWTYHYQDRLFPCAYISLADAELACAELDWALEHGARHILIRPAPVPGRFGTRSPGLPEFDKFWARVNEANIFVVLHVSDSGYDDIYRRWAGSGSEFLAFDRSDPLKACIDSNGRAIGDMISALIAHGVMNRFPNIRWVSAENGSIWVPGLMEMLKRAYGQMPKDFTRHPVDTFKECVYVAPYYEEDLNKLKEHVPAERMLFGSDWPHPEGLALPLDYINEVKDFTPAEQQMFMSSNLKDLLEGKR